MHFREQPFQMGYHRCLLQQATVRERFSSSINHIVSGSLYDHFTDAPSTVPTFCWTVRAPLQLQSRRATSCQWRQPFQIQHIHSRSVHCSEEVPKTPKWLEAIKLFQNPP